MVKFKVVAKIPEQTTGWLETNLPKPAMMRLQKYIETAKKNPISMNDKLAGNITKSLVLEDKDDWFFKNVLSSFIVNFNIKYPEYSNGINILTENAPYCLDQLWVNFQKEYEFNPLHNHTGLYSFVIFMKIPTHWQEQHALPLTANSNLPSASNFAFVLTEMDSKICKSVDFSLCPDDEGMMLFFPSWLMHQVYPFYNCDKERISISGNIKLDISENSMKQFRSQQKVYNN